MAAINLLILIRRVIAKDVHVESGAFLNHRKANAASADDGDCLAGDLVAEEWQERVPRRPFLFAHQALALPHLARKHAHHEKRKLGSGFGEHVGRVRERNFVFVGVGAIDVVEPDGDLRHDLERPLPCFEYFGVDGIAQSSDQPVDPALHFPDDQLFRRRLRPLENVKLISALAQTVLRRIADARRCKHAKTFVLRHNCRRI